MKLDVINIKGESTGRQVELPENIFGIEPNEHVVYLSVKSYLASQRQGTHKSKERGEIAGSTKKIKRQKGTGTARAGSIKSPVFRGGGRIFGPKPRNYGIKLNKKVNQLARKSVLSHKATSGQLVVVEDFGFEAPKTKEYIKILNNLKLADQKTLLVLGEDDKTVYLSSRNVPGADVEVARNLNTYRLMNANTVILSESSIEAIKELF